MKNKHNPKLFLLLALLANIVLIRSQTTWSVNPVQSPFRSGGLMLLLSDGSVLCKSSQGNGDGFGNMWFKLTPDAAGSYMNGSWSIAAPMRDTRLYFSSQVMKDGKVYVAGGEYGSGGGLAELYDPFTNSWIDIPAGFSHYFGDANSAILDNGKILQADLVGNGKGTFLYNPQTNAYSSVINCLGRHDESTWIKLPDNSILFVDLNSTSSERYIPSLNQWTLDATVPIQLYDPYVFETGPAMLLPNGKVICFGSAGTSAIYTPSGNSSPGTWAAGPPLPAGRGCPDTQAAMKVDGKIIFTASESVTAAATAFDPPTYFYEYDYIANTFTALQAPGGGATVNDSAFNFNMLNLPDGTIMLSHVNTKDFYFHKPSGNPLAAGVPTISSITQNNCANSFTATGMLFNGISEGASYGDDWQMNTNFPIIRLQSGSNVYYAKTFHWNHTGVKTGNLADTTEFSLPPGIPGGTYSLYLVVNGIASAPYTFTFNTFPTLTSPLTLPTICSGATFTYNAASSMTGTTIQWTRAAIAGIANPAVSTPQSSNPNETFTNTTNVPKTVVYSYTLTNGGCQTFYAVNCVVSNGPPLSIYSNTLICPGALNTLTASGADSYTWSTGALTETISISPSVTTVYSISATDLFGCSGSAQTTVTVKPSPIFTLTSDSSICEGEEIVLTVTGNATAIHWSTGASTPTILVSPTTSTLYTIALNITGGCPKVDTVAVTVNVCTGMSEISATKAYKLYPNPFSDQITIELRNNMTQNLKLVVTDALGQLMEEHDLMFEENHFVNKVSLNKLERGIYFMILQDKTSKTCYRIIKE